MRKISMIFEGTLIQITPPGRNKSIQIISKDAAVEELVLRAIQQSCFEYYGYSEVRDNGDMILDGPTIKTSQFLNEEFLVRTNMLFIVMNYEDIDLAKEYIKLAKSKKIEVAVLLSDSMLKNHIDLIITHKVLNFSWKEEKIKISWNDFEKLQIWTKQVIRKLIVK